LPGQECRTKHVGSGGPGLLREGAAPGAGYRNGYRRGRLRTADGPIEYGVPQVADRAEPFASRVRAGLAGRTAELERLAVERFARGLSTRDIEAAFRDATGSSVLSRTAVSQVTAAVAGVRGLRHPGPQRGYRGLLLCGRRRRAADRWRGISAGEFEQRQLRAIREELNRAHAARIAPAVTAPKAGAVRKLRS
jgi:hypothetical protein